MLRGTAGVSLLMLCIAFAAASPAQAVFCKKLKGEWVGFGEDDTRKEAESRLDKEVATWGERYQITPVKAKNRKTSCEIYLKALNEYFCTANAEVCR
jgi:hypothetical protein